MLDHVPLPTNPALDSQALAYAHVHGDRCARVRWTRQQLAGALLIVGVAIGGAAWAPFTSWLVGAMLIALLSVAVLGLRLLCVAIAFHRDPMITIPPTTLAALDPASLPGYMVLVPLYREPEVVPHLLAALTALDYPTDQLDIQFFLEPDDLVTAAALTEAGLPPHMRLTRAPAGLPRTKPRACNAGLADATGDFLVIFDAEDRPEPDQLRKAVVAYRQLPADAPPDLRVATHWRDEDGRWLEAVSAQRLLPGAWTRLEFEFADRQIWRAEGHQRGWTSDLLRRSRELDISFFSAAAYHGPLTVANLRAIPRPIPAVPPPIACTTTTPPPATVALMARWQAAFTHDRVWQNLFDPEEVAVDVELILPDGCNEPMPAFYFQDYTSHLDGAREVVDASGPPGWRVADRAWMPGTYRWRLLVAEAGSTGREVGSGTFLATAAATSQPGYLRRSRQKPELLAHEDGSFFYPIGQNLAQAVDLQQPFEYPFAVPPDQGTFTYDRYLAHLAGAGMNFARIWLTPWSFGLEGNPRWQNFHGLGRDNLANAGRLGHIRNFTRYLAEVQQYRKPVLVAEYGGRAELGAPSADYLEAQLHSGLWASLVRPFAGAALHWWWNFTEGTELYPPYRDLSAFAIGIDRITHDFQPVDPVVAGAGETLAAAGMQDADAGFNWAHQRAIYEHWAVLPTATGGRLLPSLPARRYRVEFCDTRTGLLAAGREIDLIPAQGLDLPPVARDLGQKLVRVR